MFQAEVNFSEFKDDERHDMWLELTDPRGSSMFGKVHVEVTYFAN